MFVFVFVLMCLLFTALTQTVVGEEQTDARLERLKVESAVLETHTRALESGQQPHARTHTQGRQEEQQDPTPTAERREESPEESKVEVRHSVIHSKFKVIV